MKDIDIFDGYVRLQKHKAELERRARRAKQIKREKLLANISECVYGLASTVAGMYLVWLMILIGG